MRFSLRSVAIAAAVAALAAPAAQPTHVVGGDLLPDLKTLKPRDVRLEFLPTGERRLRFSNEVVNAHTGVLEVAPAREDCNGNRDTTDDRTAYQRIFRDQNADGAFTRGVDTVSRLVQAGCLAYHPTHDHWHFEDFALYELRTYNADGTVGARVRATPKVGFCLADEYRRLANLLGSPSTRYYDPWTYGCSGDTVMGISVGWGDQYEASRDGQHIDVTGLADGRYCLVSTADPSNRLKEKSERNNKGRTRLELTATTVTQSGRC